MTRVPTDRREGLVSDEGTDPGALTPDGDANPEAIFGRFVANAYRSAGPVPPALIEHEARWVATVEELLDDGAVTEVGARPILRARDPVPSTGDTDVTRAVMHPARAGTTKELALLAASPLAPLDASDAVTARHRPVSAAEAAASSTPAASPPAVSPAPEPVALRARAKGSQAAPSSAPPRGVMLLEKRKAPSLPPPSGAMPRQELETPLWKSVVRAPSTQTQRREALLVVPEVAKVEAPASPMREGSEDGMMPGGELDRKLGDMAILLRYGHETQVQREIDTLQAQYPRDLLMLRRISEFWVATGRIEHARELLFSLATGLFERRNVEGMRQALEQVLVLEPGNERATRLVALLEQRPGIGEP